MNELKVGIVGCGGIGAVHVKSWGEVEGARIVAACDADQGRAEATGAAAYTDYVAMLEQEQLDVVDICTPPNLHPDIAVAALSRGIATVCEKPLARTPDEARRIVEASEASQALLMTAFCHRFHPPVELVRGLIQDGTLGRVLMFRNRYGTRFTGVEHRWFSNAEIAGGGVLMDTSVHSIDLFRYLVGEVAEVAAFTATYSPDIYGVEDSAALVLKSDSGAIGVIEGSWMTPWSANVIEIYGEHGAAVIDYDDGVTKYRLHADGEWRIVHPEAGDRFVRELQHFAAVLRGKQELRVSGRDGLRAVEIIHQAYGQAG
jgi:predicted dehydrogenase